MKRIKFFVLSIMTLCIATASYGQNLTHSGLERQLEKSNERIEHPRRGKKAKTWIKRGELFLDIANVNIQNVLFGVNEMQVKLAMGDPEQTKTITTESGKTRKVLVYDNIDLYFEGGALAGWEEKETIVEDPLKKAYKSFSKAEQLDTDNKREGKLEDGLNRLQELCITKGYVAFTNQKFEEAFKLFDLHSRAYDFEVMKDNPVDTSIFYNAALAAHNAKKWDEAAEYYEKTVEYNYGGEDPYIYLKSVYIQQEDSTKALETLKEGFNEVENPQKIVLELVDFYIKAGKAEDALEYLKFAKKNDPGNARLHFAEGTLHDRLGNIDEAVEAYNKAIELDPDFFDAYYNLGVVYYNKAVEIYAEASEIMDDEKYNKMKSKGDEMLKKALEPMEKAHELNPGDVGAMETLKTLYYRLQMQEKLDEIKEKLEIAKG